MERIQWTRRMRDALAAAAAVLAVSTGAPGAYGGEAVHEALGPAHGSANAVIHRFDHRPAGTVVLGLGYSGTPFAFKRDGKPRGFEVDLARAMADARGYDLEVRWFRGGDLIPALRAGEVHMVNVGAVPGELPAGVDVVPYLLTGVHAVVRRDNPFAVHSAEDLSGTMVIATMGTPGEDFAQEIRSRVGDTGRAPVEVHTMPMARYTPVAVRFAHASAYFAPTAAAALQVAEPNTPVKVVPGVFKPTGRLGFALPIEDAEFKMYLRLALAKVVATGAYERLLSKYHIPKDCSPFR